MIGIHVINNTFGSLTFMYKPRKADTIVTHTPLILNELSAILDIVFWI